MDQVKAEASRYTKQATTAKQKLSKILNENREKMIQISPEIVDEIFELRSAIQLKKYNEKFLTEEIEKLLEKPNLQDKVKAADSSTPEQFMLKKTKYEAQIIDHMKELAIHEFKLTRQSFFDDDEYQPISEEDARKFEENSQQALKEITTEHLNVDVLIEYMHLAKLMEINRKLSKEIEEMAKRVALDCGDNFEKIKSQIEEKAFDDRGDSFVKLKPDEGLKAYQLEDFLDHKPKKQEKEMESIRLNIKQNVIAGWRKRIQDPEDILIEKQLISDTTQKGENQM